MLARLRHLRPLIAVTVLGLLIPSVADAIPDRGMSTETPNRARERAEDGQNPVPLHRLWYASGTFARVNPLGLISVLSLGWRYRLFDSDSRILQDTYTHLGLNARGSPAFGRVGVHAEIQPAAVFKAWVDYEFVGYFGTFDQIFSAPNEGARYSDRTIAELGKNTGATIGTVFTTGAVLQAAVGPVAIRSTFQATRYELELEDGHAFFYDQYWDRFAPNGGFMFLNDLDLMGIIGKVRVGARWTWSDTLGADRSTEAGLAHHRVGPLFAYQFHDRGPGARFDQPTLFVLAQWWAQHPYRTGAEQPAALPLIAMGLAFRGDVLGRKPPGREGIGSADEETIIPD